jgi:Predicted transcriptional regulator
MPESEHSQDNIAYIRTHVDNLERMVRFQIASNPGSKAAITETLKARAGAADFYLALAEGPLTQDELAKHLDLDRSGVSRIATHLFDAGIVNKVRNAKGAGAYVWSDLEQLLGVSKLAKKLAGDAKPRTPRRAGKGAPSVQDRGSVATDESDPE